MEKDLPVDALQHDELAELILVTGLHLGAGKVLSVEGDWGRGKTDVLSRVAKLIDDDEQGAYRVEGPVLWLNPWQYARPDLLSPLVLDLLDRIDSEKLAKPDLRQAVGIVLRAGVRIGTRMFLPDRIVEVMDDEGEKLLKELLGDVSARKPDLDPVACMGEQFRALVRLVLGDAEPDKRLLICVDDLDRCQPQQQVAMLEALHFLTAAGADATFVVGLDPRLAGEALRVHYGTESLDTERYLDKIFDLRLPLRGLGRSDVDRLAAGHVDRITAMLKPDEKPLEDLVGAKLMAKIPSTAQAGCDVPELRNPRILRRVFDRFMLVSFDVSASEKLKIESEKDLCRLFFWLGLTERWPSIRTVFQSHPVDPSVVWGAICTYSRGQQHNALPALMALLPDAKKLAGFREMLDLLGGDSDKPDSAAYFKNIDDALKSRGL